MKKIYNVFALLVVALVGLFLTACSEDNYDTNPYNKSGINLLAFGPSPTTRAKEIRITGTNLNSVDKVVFPGGTLERAGKIINIAGAEVEKSAFNSVDKENIYVNIPDESVPGKIRLVAGSDTIVSEGTLTFLEPITVTSVSPTAGLNAGDEISIKGDYVYNIAEVVFPSGVSGAPVLAENFTYVSRGEIRVIVPLAAESGTLSFNDGADWEEDFKTPIEVITASVSSITEKTDFGQQIQIVGVNLHTVESVIFPGGVTADFTVSDDHTTITATVPAETKSGSVSLLLYSGDAITTKEITVPTIAITSVSKEKDVKVGDVIVITGENFDRIETITLPGYGVLADNEYTISGNTLTFTVPEGMSDGNLELYQNSFITVTQKFMMYSEAPEIVIWAGNFEIGSWNAGLQELAWGGYDWSTAKPGQVLTIYLKPNWVEGWSQIRVGNGSWAALPGTLEVNPLAEDDTKFTVTLTQAMIDEMVANGGLVICGAWFTVTKITLSVLEDVIWSGNFALGSWAAGMQELAWGGYDWSQVSAGTTLKVYYEVDTSVGYINIRFGNGSWQALPSTQSWGQDGNASPDPSETSIKTVLTDADIEQLRTAGGLVICGAGIFVKKIVLQ
ncbi:MAG: hypothetical protein IK075_00555 [Prevotella sp.]|nr:hypothetical protein [Prevotella sp.]